jgi:hypothetical protein
VKRERPLELDSLTLVSQRNDATHQERPLSKSYNRIVPRVVILLRDTAPLVLAYAATFLGTQAIVHSFPGPERTPYLLVSVVIPQLGLWAVWGRATTPLVTMVGRPREFQQAIRHTLWRLPLLSVPTIVLGTVALVVLPLIGQLHPHQLLRLGVAAVVATLMVSHGNVLRNTLLYFDRRNAYFWVQLWIAAGIPALVAIVKSTEMGVLVAGACYIFTLFAMTWQYIGRNAISASTSDVGGSKPSRRSFLRGDKLGWAIGLSQIVTAFSAAIELPLLAALDSSAVLTYFAVSRFAQASIAVAVRPIERALPDAVVAATSDASAPAGRSRWRHAVSYSLSLSVIGGLGLIAYASPLADLWLDVSPSLPFVIVVGALVAASPIYRAMGSIQVASRLHSQVAAMAVIELSTKLLLAVALIPSLGAAGLAISALSSLLISLALAWITGCRNLLMSNSRRHNNIDARQQ